MPPVRLVQLNVKRFTNQQGQSTAEAIGEALASLRPSLVAFNEVDVVKSPQALQQISERLGMRAEFFGHVRGRYGNALLSAFPVVSVAQHHLRGGTEIKLPVNTPKFDGTLARAGPSLCPIRNLAPLLDGVPLTACRAGQLQDEECGMAADVSCEVQPLREKSNRRLRVSVTHLDHMSEEQRIIQLEHITEILSPQRRVSSDRSGDEQRSSLGIHDVLIGDMNALTRTDYSDVEWEALEQLHASNSWSPPASGCLDVLSRHGFVDCVLATGQTVRALTTPAMRPRVRVDYCFVRGDGVDVEATSVLDRGGVESECLSDHLAVITDLVFH